MSFVDFAGSGGWVSYNGTGGVVSVGTSQGFVSAYQQLTGLKPMGMHQSLNVVFAGGTSGAVHASDFWG